MGGAPLLRVGHILDATNKYMYLKSKAWKQLITLPNLPVAIAVSDALAVISHRARDESPLSTRVVGSSVAVT